MPLVHPLHLALIGWLAWTPTMAEKKRSLLLKLESSPRGTLERIQPSAAAAKRRDCLITPPRRADTRTMSALLLRSYSSNFDTVGDSFILNESVNA